MVDNTLRSVMKVEHEMEHLIESSSGGSKDESAKEFQEIRRITEQAALAAFKVTNNWGKEALNKVKEHVEEI